MKSRKFKRIVSAALSVAMTATFLPNLPALAEDNNEPYPYTMFASSSAEGAITINTGNFNVNGNIATNGTIVSNGNMNINGTTTEHADESMLYVLKKLDYAYFSGENVTTYTEDYTLEDLNININNPIDVDGTIDLTGSINLNSGIKAIDDITINGEVKNSNNAVICSETGDINIETSNVSFNGLIYAPYGDIVIDTDNLNLNNVVIIGQTITIDCPNVNANYSSSMAELIGNESDMVYTLDAFGNYDSNTNTIGIEWYSNYAPEYYEVLESDDNVNYSSVAAVTDNTNYDYVISETFDTKYFKVTMTDAYGDVIESVPFVVTRQDETYTIDFIDSDEDGVPDIYEKMFGTDSSEVDTDFDGLTDYQEIYITDTDPVVFDSITKGISDGDADLDNDGLSNATEISLGTNPLKEDSDGDTLSDYDEINVYGTNPIESDTDEDGLTDNEELIFNVDPLNPDSNGNGILDDDEYYTQEIDNSCFDESLFDNNIAVPSLSDVTAKGNINKHIDVHEYTGYLIGDERVYVGKTIEIANSDIQSAKLSFTLDNSYNLHEYTLSGQTTNGLLICYNDGENTLPLETNFNADNKTLSADISSDGIYFVLDVMSWMESLGLELPVDGSPYITTTTTPKKMAKSKSVTTSNTSTSIADTIITPKGQVDIVFIVDTTGSMGGIINNVQNNLKAFVDDIKSAGITPSFALVEYRDITCDGTNSTNTKKNSDNENWFRNADEFKKAIANLGVAGGGDGPETAIDGLEMAHRLDMRDSAQKFFILVTDADCKTENNYGINSMDDLIQSLKNDNINVSVVSTSDYSSYYSKLYGTTGGVFANINGNFKNELLTISDKINATTNDGYWVFLKGLTLKYAKLDTKPSALSSADTDKDTLLDNRELKSLEPTITINFSDYFRLMYGNPAGIIFNYPNAKAYEYYSDPTFEDTDYDGIDDNIDNQKLDNSFSGTLEMEYDDTIESDVDYSFDLRSFFREQSKYNVQLSKISVLLSGTIYYGDYLFLNDGLPRSAYNLLKYHGFEDLKIYKIADGSDEFSIPSYSDNHLSEICIGHQKVKYNGKEKDVVAIVVRGTNGTIEEWTSNFDIGSTDELNAWKNWDLSGGTNSSSFDYTLNYFLNHDIDELNAFADWKNQDNHKGFDIATNRILKFVNAYVNKYVDKSIVTYWVTGHSRGAGIANLLSAYLIDNKNTVFAYTFAAPNTTTSDNYENEKYNSIFNIINQDDFVPRLPMDEWHFNKYGCTKTPISIADDYEKEWENLTGIFDYDPDTIGLEKTITKIAEVGKDSHDIYDRNNCYIFTCDCHGDGSFDDETTITNYGISKKSREEAKSKIPDNALPYCIIEDTGIIRYNFTVCQTPEYFMQILAAQMAGELTTGNGKGLLDENFTFLCSLNIADRYESAKKAIVKSSIGGLKHPHYVESYYVLAKHTK